MSGSRGNLTEKKLKYQFWPWLLHTQEIEVHQAQTDKERAEELCDLISSAIQWIEDLGYSPDAIFAERVNGKSEVFRAIVAKYREKFREVLEELKIFERE